MTWEPRPAGLPLLLGHEEGPIDRPEAAPASPPEADRELVVLLPVRNGESDLAGYLECVSRFADAVVSLDDGSTDRTREILEGHPLVEIVLTNQPRPTFEGWDDAANRNRLLEAAAALRPRWILSLDVDERIDEGDAAALRAFLSDAPTHLAYQFRVHRMIGGLDRYDQSSLLVCRLFAYEPEHRFPDRRLHFVPIPESIPPSQWTRTTLRIQHLAGMDEARRQERFRKYREADPDAAFQAGYDHLLAPPGPQRGWMPRPAGLPVVPRGRGGGGPAAALDLDGPVLSAIVIAQDDEDTIERSVRSVVNQEVPVPFEVIVVVSGTDRTAEIVRDRFPDVALIELPGRVYPGEARNAGVRAARGDFVSFPGSHVELLPASLTARVRAHEQGYPMVTGSIINGSRTRSGWASYFLDHSTALPGRASGELRGPPAHCSYARDFLLEAGGFPEDMRAGEDTVVNNDLFRRGYRAYRSRDIRLIHRSPCRDPVRLVRHHWGRGRALGRVLLTNQPGRPGAAARQLAGYVPGRLRRVTSHVRRWGQGLESEYRRALPLVALGALAAWAGARAEIGLAEAREHTGGQTPGVTVLVVGLDRKRSRPIGRADVIMLARLEPLHGQIRVVSIPRDLYVDIPLHGEGRLNDAYYMGAFTPESGIGRPAAGAELLRRTVQRALGVWIDDHVIVDFVGFRRVVDALHGIEVAPTQEIHDEFVGEDGELFAAHFRAGRQHLDGEQALRYARTRHVDTDFGRRGRHLEIIRSVIDRSRRVRSPVQLTEFCGLCCVPSSPAAGLGPRLYWRSPLPGSAAVGGESRGSSGHWSTQSVSMTGGG